MDRKIVYSELCKLHARKQRDGNLKEISGDMEGGEGWGGYNNI